MVKTTLDTGKWNDGLSVGIDILDNDHKRLFSLLSQLEKINKVETVPVEEILVEILSELYAYTDYYFAREELLMKACGYPHVENHRHVHEMIRSHVKYSLDNYQRDAFSVNLELLQDFMEAWLIDHIGEMDQNYMTWMQGKEDLIEKTNIEFEKTRKKLSLPKKPRQKTKLLVVDDEVDICKAVCTSAESLGYQTAYTVHGKELDNLYTETVNVIILDLFLPDIDGIELLRNLAEKECKAAIILMSGKDPNVLHSAMLLAESRGLKIIGTLNKPFERRELQTLLSKAAAPKRTPGTKNDKSSLTVQELQTALDEQEILPYYQPKVRIDTGKPIGFEALARWQHPHKGMISPGEFIPLFEKYDLIDGLTSLMMDKTFAQGSNWIQAGLDLKISINVSVRVLISLDTPEKLLAKTNAYDLDSSIVTLEVTESAVSEELANSLDILTRLSMKGFLLSIDDFGTGFSSMLQLSRAPFNELKVDQSFVKDMDTDEEKSAICESSIDLAHKLNMTTTAEGIETKAVWDILKEFYCTEGQGYYFGRPMPADKFEEWYRERMD